MNTDNSARVIPFVHKHKHLPLAKNLSVLSTFGRFGRGTMSTSCNVIAIKNHNIKLHAHEKVSDVVFYTGNMFAQQKYVSV